MFNLSNFFNKSEKESILSKDAVAELLKTTPEALEAFENAYAVKILDSSEVSENLFEINAKQAARMQETMDIPKSIDTLIPQIVDELLEQTTSYTYKQGRYSIIDPVSRIGMRVNNADISSLPESLRPQLTGYLIKKDVEADSYLLLISMYREYTKEKNAKKRRKIYDMFRQGLDILDLDPVTYEIIGTNPNSIGHWLPPLAEAVEKQTFFKIPNTTVIKVPMTLLQLTRQDYFSLTPTTLRIVDEYCQKAFNLDESKEYFIKTGTYSSKFDFRNAHVHGAKEVRELGEYLLFIHFQAAQMASPLTSPTIYGAATSNEWVVREFIQDKENNPCIYKGMPLHTEYRIFVDFDEGKIIGINPYWDPDVVKQRFGHEADANNPHHIHDYVIYRAHEETLMRRYNESKDEVKRNIELMLADINLSGQWSIDVMQNADDFYIIDMALAANSALSHCVPKNMLKYPDENWLPRIPTNFK